MLEVSDIDIERLLLLPLPPPWILRHDNVFYNEVTNEISTKHPAEIYLELISHKNEAIHSASESIPLSITTPQQLEIPHEPHHSSKSHISKPFTEYRCTWKDISPMGQTNYFGLTIRFNLQTNVITIKFDGINAKWQITDLEGPYGPIHIHDLFIGAKIKLFGRNLTITSASPETVQWIDCESKQLLKKQEWMRKKIESIGSVPVIKNPPLLVHGTRNGSSNGSVNLRKIVNENSKLGEQFANLGLTHFLTTLNPEPSTNNELISPN